MNEPLNPEPTRAQTPPTAQTRTVRFRAGAVIALAVAVGLILWLTLRNNDSGSAAATAVSAAQLQTLASSVGHPIFWLGDKKDNTYELTRKSDGSIIVRYLPLGVEPGAQGQFWSVATYPFSGAFAAIQRLVQQGGVVRIKLAHGGLAEYDSSNQNNVHAAYPNVDYQIEVFAPGGQAVAMVNAGELTSFGGPQGGPVSTVPKPRAASLARLTALAGSLGHPLYWVGPKKGYTYELTRESSGKVIIRYLVPGAQIGAAKPYLTVATYPLKGALAAVERVAKEKGQKTITLAGGGLAVFDPKLPSNVHLAYPGSDYQIEVFDPAGKADRIVAAGRITTLG
jgi:hypothetical protein